MKKVSILILTVISLLVNNNSAARLSDNSAPVNSLEKGGYINKWLITGPFPNKELDKPDEKDGAYRSGFHKDYFKLFGGEEYAVILKNTNVKYLDEIGSKKIAHTYYLEGDDGVVDFKQLFLDTDYKTAYAYSYIYSSKKQLVHFYFGSDDCPKVWVNGELALSLWMGGRGAKPRDDYFKVKLDKGLNPVMVKIENGQGDWKFIMEAFTEEQHNALMNEEIKTWSQYWERNAKLSPDGYYPMWLSKKLAFWTVIGVENDDKECIICEDGTIEPHKRGYSITPVIYMKDKLISRGDVKISQSLKDNQLPIPLVKWQYDDIIFKLTGFCYGEPGSSCAYFKYSLKNNSNKLFDGKLFLLIRPFQVYPPWQGGGGFAKIKKIKYEKDKIVINNKNSIYLLTGPDKFGVNIKHDRLNNELEGDIIEDVKSGQLPELEEGDDTEGFASAGIEFNFSLKPGEKKDIYTVIPLHNNELDNMDKKNDFEQEYEKLYNETVSSWKNKISRIDIDIPEQEIIDTLKANINYIFIMNDGKAIQPGSRCYDKSFIRDGSIIGTALMDVGFNKVMKDYINWYSGYQFNTGEIPCVVDNKAADPFWEKISEYDSQGEYMYGILNYYYFSGDKDLLEQRLSNIIKCLKFLVKLRKKRMTTLYREQPEKKVLYGIIPKTYSDKHFYWDSFWALKAWKSGKKIFKILERDDLTEWAGKQYIDLKESVYSSIREVMEKNKIDFIPESVEQANYYPVSTAGAVVYCDELENIPEPALSNTYKKYSREITYRLKNNSVYRFTPYEVRNSTAFLFMGQKEEALRILRFILEHRKPKNWFQFTEVVNSEERKPTLFGDMPHTWIGAEYIIAVRSLFVYEKDGDLILCAGLDEKWLEREEGVSVKNLPTYYGKISYWVKKIENELNIKITGNVKPDKKFILKSPIFKKKIDKVLINGKIWNEFTDDTVMFNSLPVEINIIYSF